MSSPDENDFLDPALDQDNEDENIIPSNPLAAQTSFDLSNELDRFRHDWQRELNQTEKSENDNGESNPIGIRTSGKKPIVERGQLRSRGVPSTGAGPLGHLKEEGEPEPDLEYEQPRTIEDKAKYLFNKAVLLEQQGRHYDAIKFYRLSMQLDADIEFKVAVMKKPTNVDKAAKKLANMALSDEESVDDDDDKTPTHTSAKPDEESLTLCEVFQEALASQNRFCDKNMTQKTTHFSALPFEVVIVILKWVVSENLDMRSLESFSRVCKGFYVCARDSEIWKLACAKIWGANNIANHLLTYSDWRTMYLNRPRLNFDGVYISKASYARSGEQSLDNFYRPWHVVEYYRYMRFFSNGTVLFLTSPDEPKTTVYKLNLKTQQTSQSHLFNSSNFYSSFLLNEHSILKGTWTLAFNKVSIVLIKRILKSALNKRGRQNKEPVLEQEHVYRIELDLTGKMNNQLQWGNYEIDILNKVTNTKSLTNFDLNKIDFPNFYFSRVKSYSSHTEAPLR